MLRDCSAASQRCASSGEGVRSSYLRLSSFAFASAADDADEDDEKEEEEEEERESGGKVVVVDADPVTGAVMTIKSLHEDCESSIEATWRRSIDPAKTLACESACDFE